MYTKVDNGKDLTALVSFGLEIEKYKSKLSWIYCPNQCPFGILVFLPPTKVLNLGSSWSAGMVSIQEPLYSSLGIQASLLESPCLQNIH